MVVPIAHSKLKSSGVCRRWRPDRAGLAGHWHMSRACNVCSFMPPVAGAAGARLAGLWQGRGGATWLRQACARISGSGGNPNPDPRLSCGWSSYLTSLAAGWVLGGHAVTPGMRMALQMRNDPRERAAGSRLASSSYGGSHIIEACLSTTAVLSRLRTSSGVNGHRALAWFLGQICWVG